MEESELKITQLLRIPALVLVVAFALWASACNSTPNSQYHTINRPAPPVQVVTQDPRFQNINWNNFLAAFNESYGNQDAALQRVYGDDGIYNFDVGGQNNEPDGVKDLLGFRPITFPDGSPGLAVADVDYLQPNESGQLAPTELAYLSLRNDATGAHATLQPAPAYYGHVNPYSAFYARPAGLNPNVYWNGFVLGDVWTRPHTIVVFRQRPGWATSRRILVANDFNNYSQATYTRTVTQKRVQIRQETAPANNAFTQQVAARQKTLPSVPQVPNRNGTTTVTTNTQAAPQPIQRMEGLSGQDRALKAGELDRMRQSNGQITNGQSLADKYKAERLAREAAIATAPTPAPIAKAPAYVPTYQQQAAQKAQPYVAPTPQPVQKAPAYAAPVVQKAPVYTPLARVETKPAPVQAAPKYTPPQVSKPAPTYTPPKKK